MKDNTRNVLTVPLEQAEELVARGKGVLHGLFVSVLAISDGNQKVEASYEANHPLHTRTEAVIGDIFGSQKSGVVDDPVLNADLKTIRAFLEDNKLPRNLFIRCSLLSEYVAGKRGTLVNDFIPEFVMTIMNEFIEGASREEYDSILDPEDFENVIISIAVEYNPGKAFVRSLLAYGSGKHAEAIKTWYLLSEQGHAESQNLLAGAYHQGQGTPKDNQEAAKWFRKAAEQGHVEAQHNLGILYRLGQGVPQDYQVAAKWYRKAAEQGYMDSQYILGVMFNEGHGVPKNDQEAAKWFQKAADKGRAEAQFNIGLMYHDGQGVPQSYQEAAKWFRKAAGQGHVGAQFKLGYMYHEGKGLLQDYQESVNWLRKAAEQGDAVAQGNLGLMYAEGKGVPQNNVLAYMLFNLAAAGGSKSAVQNRDIALSQMTPAEIAKGQALAAQWKPGTPLPTS